ncbi:MAG: MMPL family transporter [Bifidobacteriaceae bacterium]|jgi:predicted RND superfamily exporter protein|nr:MMPL family transporter [Bifidobacteriaceae bacterium]
MDWIAHQVLRFRKTIITIFAVALAVFGTAALTLHINYDMTQYLPTDANSTKALSVMEKSFKKDLPNATVMVPVNGVAQGKEYKEKIAKITGVEDVMWLDDSVDLTKPVESLDQKTVSSYYKDGKALYQVTVEAGDEQAAVGALKDLAGGKTAVIGNAADMASSQKMALNQSFSAMLMLAPIILIVLIVATRSWVEPLLYLASIGASIVINLGISSMMGEISFISMAVVPILQLAVALDYAVFLSTAYTAARETTTSSVDAMRTAMKKSATSIFASALVGIFAFAALISMNFKIGPDMGWGLVRGVVISYITVITLLPALTVASDKWIQKTHHRRFLPSFTRTSSALVKIRILALIIIAIMVIPSYLGQARNSFIYGSGDAAAGSTIANDTAAIKKVFSTDNSLVLLVPRGDSAAEKQIDSEVGDLAGVKSITSYATSVGNQVPEQYIGSLADTFYSKDYARIIITVTTKSEGEAAFHLVKQIRAVASALYPGQQTYLAGQSANMYDMKNTVTADNERVDTITIVAIFVILLLLFRSIILPILAIVTIKSAIFINMAIPYFMGTELSFIGYLIVSVIMMGSAIDYGILLLDHYLAERRTQPKIPAMKSALKQAIPAMFVSALILTLAGITLGATSSNAIVQAMGWLIGRGGAIAFLASITLLPSLLLVFDRLIPKLSLKLTFFTPGAGPTTSPTAPTAPSIEGEIQ